ncbi:MAG: hypothetical protein VBE63_18240 [Lamprobacter sp.]|uniref:hypothetical protein n=1 Tax=Lamprobacter sp. TaxID=3100796 RepID=UPI002B25A92E|nr:hypothetical protein [Lamprobacter sp.]MEA3641855.1 hypothetical protein [Lamprobacter sp.]
MPWQQISPHCLQHTETGARIAKCGRQGAAGALAYRYLAYGPDRAAGWSYRAWSNGSAKHWSGQQPPIRYALGERIPQARELLGAFETAAEAKVACEAATHSPDHLPDTSKMVSPQEPTP